MANKVIKYVVLAVIVANVIIIAYVFVGGSAPPPKPLPNPNGYDDFVKAGEMVKGNVVDYDKMGKEELAALVATNAEALKLLRLGLSRECREPTDFSQDYIDKRVPEFTSFKQLVVLVCAEGRLAELDGHTNDAVDDYLDGIRFGVEFSRGGLLIAKLVGIACENIAMSSLQSLIKSLDADKCRDVAQALQTIDAREEPITETLQNEKLWVRKTYGLRGQIENLVMRSEAEKPRVIAAAKSHRTQLKRRQTMLEFAARAYELEKGKPPKSAADLVPDYLKAVPNDPVTGKDLGLGP
jgi:hypothetical protein